MGGLDSRIPMCNRVGMCLCRSNCFDDVGDEIMNIQSVAVLILIVVLTILVIKRIKNNKKKCCCDCDKCCVKCKGQD